MAKLVASLIVVLALALSACVPSVYPLYTDKDLRFDPALLGTWAGRPDDESWTFTKDGETSYSLVIKDSSGSVTFEAHLLQLGKYRFIDMAPDRASIRRTAMPDMYKAMLIPGHWFLKVTDIAPVLRMGVLNPEWLGKRLEKQPGELAHRGKLRSEGDHDIVLLARTRELQEFFLKHADDKDAFGKPSELKRIK